MSGMASQITSIMIVYAADQRKHQSSTSLAFVTGIHRSPVYSPHKGPVTWKMFPFDDVIMYDNNYCLFYSEPLPKPMIHCQFGTQCMTFSEISNEHNKISSEENVFGNVACHSCPYLFRPDCDPASLSGDSLNSSSDGQNGRHFADDIFKCIFLNEKVQLLTKISLKFVPKGPIDNNPSLV